MDVCKIRDDWTEARVASILPPFAGGPSEIVSITVFSPTELDLCAYQKTSRLVKLCVTMIFLKHLVSTSLRCRFVSLKKVQVLKYLSTKATETVTLRLTGFVLLS